MVIHGTKGYIRIENINNFESLSVYDGQHQLVRRVERPTQITGYEYEVRACLRALESRGTVLPGDASRGIGAGHGADGLPARRLGRAVSLE